MPPPAHRATLKLIICCFDFSAHINDHSVGDYADWDVSARPNSNMGDMLKDLENKGFRVPLS